MKKLPTFYPFTIGTGTLSYIRSEVYRFFNRDDVIPFRGLKRATTHDIQLWR